MWAKTVNIQLQRIRGCFYENALYKFTLYLLTCILVTQHSVTGRRWTEVAGPSRPSMSSATVSSARTVHSLSGSASLTDDLVLSVYCSKGMISTS